MKEDSCPGVLLDMVLLVVGRFQMPQVDTCLLAGRHKVPEDKVRSQDKSYCHLEDTVWVCRCKAWALMEEREPDNQFERHRDLCERDMLWLLQQVGVFVT